MHHPLTSRRAARRCLQLRRLSHLANCLDKGSSGEHLQVSLPVDDGASAAAQGKLGGGRENRFDRGSFANYTIQMALATDLPNAG
jgi:hypothetical protein